LILCCLSEQPQTWPAFVFALQPALMLETLPHTRAEPSDTRWDLKEGGLYGFFSVLGADVFSPEVFLLFKPTFLLFLQIRRTAPLKSSTT